MGQPATSSTDAADAAEVAAAVADVADSSSSPHPAATAAMASTTTSAPIRRAPRTTVLPWSAPLSSPLSLLARSRPKWYAADHIGAMVLHGTGGPYGRC